AGERRRFLGDSFASALDGGARKLYPRRAVIRSFCEWLFSSIDTTLRSAGWCESSIFEKLNAIPATPCITRYGEGRQQRSSEECRARNWFIAGPARRGRRWW